jgi:hypothetical protein
LSVNTTATVNSDTSISFTVPNLAAQNLTIYVYISNLGYAGFINAVINFTVSSISPSSGSQYGNVVTIQGSGFSSAN